MTGSRREFFVCNLCALCGLTLFEMLVLPFLVWPKPLLRRSSRRAKKKTVSITKHTKRKRHENNEWATDVQKCRRAGTDTRRFVAPDPSMRPSFFCLLLSSVRFRSLSSDVRARLSWFLPSVIRGRSISTAEMAEDAEIRASLHCKQFKFARRDKIFTAPRRVYLGGGRDFALPPPLREMTSPPPSSPRWRQ